MKMPRNLERESMYLCWFCKKRFFLFVREKREPHQFVNGKIFYLKCFSLDKLRNLFE